MTNTRQSQAEQQRQNGINRILNWWEVYLSDNAIEPKNLDYIFEPFVTLETKYSAKGTGIGLGLCKEILERHGGSIVAKSEGLNKGSTFIISLPIIKN